MTSSSSGASYGALLLGGLAAFSLSGIVTVQTIVYFKLYTDDTTLKRTIVKLVWVLDLLHSIFICRSLIFYFVDWWGKDEYVDEIPWSIALTVVVTAIQTLIVHCCFSERIHKLSRGNWKITAPILSLTVARLISAAVSTVKMATLRHFSLFAQEYGWIFTIGLSFSASVDILITGWMCFFLGALRQESKGRTTLTSTVRIVDLLIFYTLENGLVTSVSALASLICWVTMSTNLVFLGLHFAIAKLYANTLLASFNTRKELQDTIRVEVEAQVQQWVRNDAGMVMDLRTNSPPNYTVTNLEFNPPETLSHDSGI